MSNEKIMNAIGQLDDDLILDAEKVPSKKSYVIYFKITAVAASVALIVLMAILLKNNVNAPVQNSEEPLLAEVEDTLPPETDTSFVTEEPVITKQPVNTAEPVSENNRTEERNEEVNYAEDVNNEVRTPEPEVKISEEPVVSYPENTEEIKPSQDSDLKEENADEVTPTETPVITEVPEFTETPEDTAAPEEDDTWTETFVATNVEHNYGIDKSESVYFVEQLYFSSLGDNPRDDDDKAGDWRYSVKSGNVLYTQAEVAVLGKYIEGKIYDALLEGVNLADGTVKETKAYIYKLSGIAEEAAVAVQIDEQNGFYLFINKEYKASSLQEFAEAYNLQNLAKLKALAVYDEWDKIISENIDSELIWEIILSGEGKPVDYDTLYDVYEVAGSIEMDVKMYGCLDVPIALYDEGYVVIYLGDINGAYYVGHEKVAQIKELIESAE